MERRQQQLTYFDETQCFADSRLNYNSNITIQNEAAASLHMKQVVHDKEALVENEKNKEKGIETTIHAEILLGDQEENIKARQLHGDSLVREETMQVISSKVSAETSLNVYKEEISVCDEYLQSLVQQEDTYKRENEELSKNLAIDKLQMAQLQKRLCNTGDIINALKNYVTRMKEFKRKKESTSLLDRVGKLNETGLYIGKLKQKYDELKKLINDKQNKVNASPLFVKQCLEENEKLKVAIVQQRELQSNAEHQKQNMEDKFKEVATEVDRLLNQKNASLACISEKKALLNDMKQRKALKEKQLREINEKLQQDKEDSTKRLEMTRQKQEDLTTNINAIVKDIQNSERALQNYIDEALEVEDETKSLQLAYDENQRILKNSSDDYEKKIKNISNATKKCKDDLLIIIQESEALSDKHARCQNEIMQKMEEHHSHIEKKIALQKLVYEKELFVVQLKNEVNSIKEKLQNSEKSKDSAKEEIHSIQNKIEITKTNLDNFLSSTEEEKKKSAREYEVKAEELNNKIITGQATLENLEHERQNLQIELDEESSYLRDAQFVLEKLKDVKTLKEEHFNMQVSKLNEAKVEYEKVIALDDNVKGDEFWIDPAPEVKRPVTPSSILKVPGTTSTTPPKSVKFQGVSSTESSGSEALEAQGTQSRRNEVTFDELLANIIESNKKQNEAVQFKKRKFVD